MNAKVQLPEITDDDPLYHQLMEEQAEDRRRWAASEMAREEMKQIADRTWPRPDWHYAGRHSNYKLKVHKWSAL